MLRLKSALCIIQALLIIVSSFAVYDSNFKFWVDRGAMELTSVTDFGFDSINSASLEISSAEKAKEFYMDKKTKEKNVFVRLEIFRIFVKRFENISTWN